MAAVTKNFPYICKKPEKIDTNNVKISPKKQIFVNLIVKGL